MVPTNTNETQEISALFAEAATRTTNLAECIEIEEQELLLQARACFDKAVHVILPVLQYIAQIINVCNDSDGHSCKLDTRGVFLGKKNVLMKNGYITLDCSVAVHYPTFEVPMGSRLEQLDQYLQMIEMIREALNKALVKADERREGLHQKREQFTQAMKAFKS